MTLLGRVVRVGNYLGKVVSEAGNGIEVLLMNTETNDYVKKSYKIDEVEVDDYLRDLTLEQYITELDDGYHLDNTIEEILLLKENNGPEILLNEVMRNVVKDKNIFINDLIDFDYDTYFSQRIKNYRQ